MPSLAILPQLIINGLIAGSIYALAASGFSLVYYVMKFLHFAQGAVITYAAYAMLLLYSQLGLGSAVSIILSIAVAVLVQHGKHGASSAAPIAKKVIEAALKGQVLSAGL